MAEKQFKLGDGGTMLIRSLDVHNAAIAMAEGLGIAGQIEVTVGRWDESGQIIGWTKRAKRGTDEILLEVFVSDLTGQDREFNSWARRMQALIDENRALKAQLASVDTPAATELSGAGAVSTERWQPIETTQRAATDTITSIGRASDFAGSKTSQARQGRIAEMAQDKLVPVNDTWLSGRPFYCRLCGAGYGEYIACEMPDCSLESVEDAQERLRSHSNRSGGR